MLKPGLTNWLIVEGMGWRIAMPIWAWTLVIGAEFFIVVGLLLFLTA